MNRETEDRFVPTLGATLVAMVKHLHPAAAARSRSAKAAGPTRIEHD